MRYSEAVRTLGRYELLQPLARGGMAEVYLARRRVAGVEKRLVIKRLRRERISDPRFLDLFVKEAQLSMALVQQNIVPVFDFGRIGDDVFLAMEHIDGKDLGSTLARARGQGMPALPAAFVAAECCHALHHAHSGVSGRHVVHRDVTPRNVLLSWSGEVKLADFGIASAMGAGDTQLVGTPGYMAPEQARGEPLDARADLYSLALVLWEMLTGAHVRQGHDAATLLEAAKRNALPEVPDTLPERLASLLRRATADDPARRIDSARTMADELDTFMVGERARDGGAAPAQQLAAWLKERWAGAGDEPAELPDLEGGRMVTFLDDGAAGVLGTGTMRSMAVTAGPAEEAGPDPAPALADAPAADGAPDEARARSADELAPAAPSAVARGSEALAASPRRARAWLAAAAMLAVGGGAVTLVLRGAGGAGGSPDAVGHVQPDAASGAALASAPLVDPDARATEPGVDAGAPPASDPDARDPDARVLDGVDGPGRPHGTGRGGRRDAAMAPTPPGVRVGERAAAPDAAVEGPAAQERRRPFTIGAKPWAHVTIDDEPARHETPATMSLTLGKHRLRFENPELGISHEVTIEVLADGPASYIHVLQ